MNSCYLCEVGVAGEDLLCDDCKGKLENPSFLIDLCCNDLYFLCRCVLQTREDPTPGFKDLYRPTHRRICDFLDKYAVAGQRCILLFPRHWIKSYIISCGWGLQRIMNSQVSQNALCQRL